MKKSISFIIFLLVFFCFLFFSFQNTLASSDEIVQKLRGDILKLLTKNTNSSLKEDIFSKIIDLSNLEIQDIKQKLVKIDPKTLSPKEKQFRQNAIAKFDEFSKYLKSYFLKDKKISLQKKAEIISLWRKNEYLPYFRKVSNFFIILKAEKIAQISNQRLKRTEDFLKRKKNTPKSKEVLKYLNKSQVLINNGVKEIYETRDLFLNNQKNIDIFLKPRLKFGVEKIKEAYDYFLKL